MNDLLADFLSESAEHLETIDQDLAAFAQNPGDKNLVFKIFRVMHTIKGTCRFLDLPHLEKTAHDAETLLACFRDKGFKVTPEHIAAIVESVARIKFILATLSETGAEPINALEKLQLMIDKLAVDLGKKINFKVQGEDILLNPDIMKVVKNPLLHLLRNSADHGIEDPATRTANGKPEAGTITLNAYPQNTHVIIEIADDGRGVPEKIQSLIFNPGFSTAETVTTLSGRGVGLDAVRTDIEKTGGSIELRSVEGQSCAFIIKLPATAA